MKSSVAVCICLLILVTSSAITGAFKRHRRMLRSLRDGPVGYMPAWGWQFDLNRHYDTFSHFFGSLMLLDVQPGRSWPVSTNNGDCGREHVHHPEPLFLHHDGSIIVQVVACFGRHRL
jgi:hypothetical protein